MGGEERGKEEVAYFYSRAFWLEGEGKIKWELR